MRAFKIRCSAIGSIMGNCETITVKQLEDLAELQSKKDAGKITEKQTTTLNGLIAKRDAKPELPEGAKTYCEQWVKEQIYSRKKEFSSKYTEKGLTVEDEAINLAADRFGWGMVSKNTKHYSNEFIEGTPDLVLADLVPDIKNSWDCFTFPLFETKINKDYWLQLQGYMRLTGKANAALIYCLMDAPETLVEAEARRMSFKAGFSEVDADFYDEVKLSMTYSNQPVDLRIKRFDVERDDKTIQMIEDRVVMCREHIATLNVNKYFLTHLKAA